MASNADFNASLNTVLAREIKGFDSLISSHQLTAGASLETYCITYESAGEQLKLALRRAQPTSDSDSSVGGISLETEATLFKLALQNDIPSPKVLYVLEDKDNLGAGFVMDWLEGETLGHRIIKLDSLADARKTLAQQCGQILARIHKIDWQAVELDKVLEVSNTADLINNIWNQYQELKLPLPMIDFTAKWLLDNIPKQSATTLVHSDFRNGNLMVNAQGINAVLDWELAHIGDPMQDLGWLCVNSWRFGNRQLEVGGFGAIEDLIASYETEIGTEVSIDALKFWQVFGSFWWSIATLTMANTWRTGETPSLERPVIGRRSSEGQMDCVNLLIAGEFVLPETQSDLTAGTQLPMPVELLASVADFLKSTVADQLNGKDSFLAKVAANSLGIAQREFLYRPAMDADEKTRLESMLGQQGELDDLRWLLVNALRDDSKLPAEELIEYLRQTVASQLFIDQPFYSALKA